MGQEKPINSRLPARWDRAVIRNLALSPPNLGSRPRESLAAARGSAAAQLPRAPPVLRTRQKWRRGPPSRSPCPSSSPAMGSAASTDRAEQRGRRGRPLGQGEASTTRPLSAIPEDSAAAAAADVRRKGCKVSPEPKEGGEPAAALPGSPSFRIYCQDAARVDALVAASDADDDNDELSRPTETSLAIRKNDLAVAGGSGELSKSKESSGWLKFRGQAIVDALYTFIICRSKAASAHSAPHPPPAVVPTKPHQPCATLPPRPAAPRPFF